ncbi:Vacuolar protein sorting-associated protein ist1 [Trifolium repens]|nr:Vacuolar protein sorting-associated protein ist1 [Trifolium repens]
MIVERNSKTLLEKIAVDSQSLIERKEIHVKKIQEDISKTLQTPEKHLAHTVVLSLIDENNMIDLLKFIIYFCEVVDRHLHFLESQSEVPPDMKEIIASLCYIGSRYSELPDLVKLLSQFSRKYGTEFITNAAKLKEDCGVKEQIIQLLSVPNPPAHERNRLLKEIADQFGIDWHEDMAASDVEEQNKLPETIADNQLSIVGMQDSVSHDNMKTVPNMEIVPSGMLIEN